MRRSCRSCRVTGAPLSASQLTSPPAVQEQVQRMQRAAEASTSMQGEGESLPVGWTPYAAFLGPGVVRWPETGPRLPELQVQPVRRSHHLLCRQPHPGV